MIIMYLCQEPRPLEIWCEKGQVLSMSTWTHRDTERETERERDRQRQRETESVCMCVCL